MHHGYIAGHQVARHDHCFIEHDHSPFCAGAGGRTADGIGLTKG